MSDDTYRVRIWHGTNPDTDAEPDEVIEVPAETTHVWQDDPHFHSPPLDIDIHPDDAPATLGIFTSESVRSPPGYDNHVETSYWQGPVEQGLAFPGPAFGCEVWGRVMFFVEPGDDNE